MAFRVFWAILTTLLCSVWLWRRTHAEESLFAMRKEPAVPWLRGAVLGCVAVASLAWLLFALVRFMYPFELEWTGGAMRDHCWRLLQNQPLYAPPNGNWIAAPLPPLFWLLGALLMNLTGNTSITVLRLISFLSTLGCAGLLIAWVRLLLPDDVAPVSPSDETIADPVGHWTGKRWGRVAAALFLALYGISGGWYDVERPEMLFLFLVLLSAYSLERAQKISLTRAVPISYFWIIASGLALTLAFLTAQQAILFFFGALAALLWRRAWAHLCFFVLVCVILAGDVIWFLNQISGGWFTYYAFRVPLAQSPPTVLFSGPIVALLVSSLPLFALLILAFRLGRRALHAAPPPELLEPEEQIREHISYAILVGMAGCALLGGLVFRLLWGAEGPTLSMGVLLCATIACVVAGRWERLHGPVRAPLYAFLLAQFVAWSYLPTHLLPTAENNAAGRRFTQVMRQLQTQGDVLCLDHGGFTEPPHLHRASLAAVLHAEKRLPIGLKSVLHSRHYVAVISDHLPDARDPIDAELLQSYALGEGPDIGGPWVLLPPRTPQPHHRVWVLRPTTR